jgi:putative lipoprotein
LADAPSTVVGEQVITPTGGPPFQFSIAFDPDAIVATHRYQVSARIIGPDGTLLFISMQAHPVITGDNPTHDVEVVVGRVP